RPRLLLADEPTGALDTASGEQIMDIFDQLNADGASILMITHEQAVADRAQKVYHLRDGRLGP
ncbi:MAG: macrolide ABC transporter ATP-binding protein, partial [Oscillospiraceae bacterium]|nr:macrolide ABC transporter ATP-binding protein [Oscillospiraceae bacterium]